MVLFLGGMIMLVSGIALLWSLRALFSGPKLDSATHDIIAHAEKARRAATQRKGGPPAGQPEEPEPGES